MSNEVDNSQATVVITESEFVQGPGRGPVSKWFYRRQGLQSPRPVCTQSYAGYSDQDSGKITLPSIADTHRSASGLVASMCRINSQRHCQFLPGQGVECLILAISGAAYWPNIAGQAVTAEGKSKADVFLETRDHRS